MFKEYIDVYFSSQQEITVDLMTLFEKYEPADEHALKEIRDGAQNVPFIDFSSPSIILEHPEMAQEQIKESVNNKLVEMYHGGRLVEKKGM